jgi:pimeloyl-ACP methyl ester carboxylesterase
VRLDLICLFILAVAAPDLVLAADPSPLAAEEVRFTSGDFALVGDLLTPDRPGPHPAIVYVWGSGPTDRKGHMERSRILRSFLDAGYAVYLYDKPGSGSSTGTFDRRRLFAQRAAILGDALAMLRERPELLPDAIGLYGSSQASYVLAVALARGCDPAFLVAWSCPMQSSVEQSAYLVGNYLRCAGRSEEDAAAAERAFIVRGRARSYAEYAAAARLLDSLPEIRDELGWAGVLSEDSFAPADAASEYLMDPAEMLREHGGFTMPVLALYAENDRQIDPVQGAAVCRELLAGRDDGLSRVATIPGADHNMILSPRGCLQDQRDRYEAVGGITVSPDFMETVAAWLEELRARIDERRPSG